MDVETSSRATSSDGWPSCSSSSWRAEIMNSDLSDAGGGFDELAEEFDRTRPVCPGELFDDLMALGGLSQSRCRIGCGIGQATVPLAERGLSRLNLATQSGSRRIGGERRRDFLSRVRARLGSWPRVTANLVGFQTVDRRIAGFSETAVASNLSYLDAVQAQTSRRFV